MRSARNGSYGQICNEVNDMSPAFEISRSSPLGFSSDRLADLFFSFIGQKGHLHQIPSKGEGGCIKIFYWIYL